MKKHFYKKNEITESLDFVYDNSDENNILK